MDENRINEIALDETHKVVENRVPLLEMTPTVAKPTKKLEITKTAEVILVFE